MDGVGQWHVIVNNETLCGITGVSSINTYPIEDYDYVEEEYLHDCCDVCYSEMSKRKGVK